LLVTYFLVLVMHSHTNIKFTLISAEHNDNWCICTSSNAKQLLSWTNCKFEDYLLLWCNMFSSNVPILQRNLQPTSAGIC